jgi:hypothetical protein
VLGRPPPEKLVRRRGAREFQPVRGDNFIAWQQNTHRNPTDYDVFARELGGGGTFRVNPRRVNAAIVDHRPSSENITIRNIPQHAANLVSVDTTHRTSD